MKIAFLAYYPVPRLKPHVALSDEFVHHPASWIVNLVQSLSRREEIELHVVGESTSIPHDQDIVVANVHYHFIKSPSTLNLSTLYFFNARRIVRKVRDVGPALIHAHGTEGSVGLAGVYSRLPCLLTLQGIQSEIEKADRKWFGRTSSRVWLMSRIERHVLRRAKYIGTRTGFATAVARAINPAASIYHTPEIMNDLFYQVEPALEEPHVVFVGTISERKDVLSLVRSMASVRERVPTAKLSLIGSGTDSYVARLKQEAGRLGIDDAIVLMGQQPPESIAGVFSRSSVFVLPSLIENSPNALAEAMCAGLCVIATNVGGIPSMVQDGVTGLLVPPRDEQALAHAITTALTDTTLRKRLAHAARKQARPEHQAEKVTETMVGVYREILEQETNAQRRSKERMGTLS